MPGEFNSFLKEKKKRKVVSLRDIPSFCANLQFNFSVLLQQLTLPRAELLVLIS